VTKSRPYDLDKDGDDHHHHHDDESCSNSRGGWSSRSSEYYSYMEDEWYFPQCMGELTILYVVAIIVVIMTMTMKSKRLNNNDHDNNINMTRQFKSESVQAILQKKGLDRILVYRATSQAIG
jgi:hypothetical protein